MKITRHDCNTFFVSFNLPFIAHARAQICSMILL